MTCFVCGYNARSFVDVLVHAQDTENDDQHRRWLSAAHGTGTTADLKAYADRIALRARLDAFLAQYPE